MSTVTTTFTSTQMTVATRSTTVSTIYATYTKTESVVVPYEERGGGPLKNPDGSAYAIGASEAYDLKVGDIIIIKGYNAKGSYVVIYNGWEQKVDEFKFYSDEVMEKTFVIQSGGSGSYMIEYLWPLRSMTQSCPISITVYRTQTYLMTSTSFVVQQHVTNVLTTGTFTKTERVSDWFESPIMIGVIVVAVAVIIMALMKREIKTKQTQLEKYT